MKTTIYYFTGTGNSLYLTRKLAKQIENCQIKSMSNQPPNQPVGGPEENIGFVFPVYYWGMPRIVKEFIENLDIIKETYIFAVVNYKGLKFDTLGMVNDVLQQKDTELAYGYGIKMPGNAINYYGSPSSEKTQKIIENADIKIDEVAKAIVRKEVRPIRRLGTFISKWGNASLHKNIEKFDKKFTVTENCNGCGTCSEVCPVGNIKIKNQKPVWQHHCERCMACIQWCPTEAIQYGKKTVKRRRYQNPDITSKDIVKGNNE